MIREKERDQLLSEKLRKELNSWMEENCETGANRRENRTSLFRSFAFYYKEQGGDPGAANDFYSVMEQRGHLPSPSKV